MKKLVCGAAVGALLVFALLGQPQAQAPAAVQPGSPPAAQPQAPTATPYVVPMPTPKAPIAEQTTPRRLAGYALSLVLVGYLQPYSRFGYRAMLNAATDAGA